MHRHNQRALFVSALCLISGLSAAAEVEVTEISHSRQILQTSNQTAIYTSTGALYLCRSDQDCLNYLGFGKCDTATGACYPGQFGQSCTTNANCQSNACSTFYRVCVQQGCSTLCLTNPANFCYTNYCYPMVNNGGKCLENNHCYSGSCVNQICTTGGSSGCGCPGCPPACPSNQYCGSNNQCVNLLPNGGYCTGNYMCQSGTCNNNICSSSTGCGCPGCPTCPQNQYCQGYPNSWAVNYCSNKIPNNQPCGQSVTGNAGDSCVSGICVTGFCSSGKPQCNCPGCPACAFGYYCDSSNYGYCQPQKSNGASCGGNSECQSYYCAGGICRAQGSICNCPGCPVCPSSQYCDSSVNGQCQSKQSNGSPCSQNQQCSSNFCYNGFCSSSGFQCGCPGCPLCPSSQYCNSQNYCVNKLGNGSPCSSNNQCKSNSCFFGTCSSSSPGCGCPGCPLCPSNQYCNSQNFCVNKQGNGAPCSSNNQCKSNNCFFGTCSGSGGGGNLPDGSYCTSNINCQSGYCNPSSGTCSKPVGSTCPGPATSCPAGQFCQYTASQGYRCTAQSPPGAFCAAGWECLSNTCTNNSCR